MRHARTAVESEYWQLEVNRNGEVWTSDSFAENGNETFHPDQIGCEAGKRCGHG